MREIRPCLLLTRPREASERFLSELIAFTGRDVRAIISPILRIVDIGELPDLSSFSTIILSSRHAVSRLGAEGLLQGREVAVVGEGTAQLATSHGAAVVALGQDSRELVEQWRKLTAPCLYCRGVHSRGALASRLSELGVKTSEVVVYDQRREALSDEAKSFLLSGQHVVAPVFSPRSAELLSAEIPASASIEVIAISEAGKHAWSGPGRVTVPKEPNGRFMLQSVADAI